MSSKNNVRFADKSKKPKKIEFRKNRRKYMVKNCFYRKL